MGDRILIVDDEKGIVASSSADGTRSDALIAARTAAWAGAASAPVIAETASPAAGDVFGAVVIHSGDRAADKSDVRSFYAVNVQSVRFSGDKFRRCER
jgi:hypothetical protein